MSLSRFSGTGTKFSNFNVERFWTLKFVSWSSGSGWKSSLTTITCWVFCLSHALWILHLWFADKVTTSRIWYTTGRSRLWLGNRSWELLQAAHVSLGIDGLSSLHIPRMTQYTEVTRQDLVKRVVYHCWVLSSHCWWIRPNRPRLQARTTAAEMGRLLWWVNPFVAGFCQVSSNTSPCRMVHVFFVTWVTQMTWIDFSSTFRCDSKCIIQPGFATTSELQIVEAERLPSLKELHFLVKHGWWDCWQFFLRENQGQSVEEQLFCLYLQYDFPVDITMS